MAQIVEAEALDSGRGQRGLPGAAKRVPLARPEHVPLGAVCPPTGQYGVGIQPERHFAAPTALRQLKPDHAAGAINTVPCQAERFTLRPVNKQNSTRSASAVLRLFRHAANSRVASSSVNHRSRPSGSFSVRIFGTVLSSPHSS